MSLRPFAIVLALLLAGCAAAPEAARPSLAKVPLKNADFAMDPTPGRACPPQWGCSMHADPSSFRFSLESDPRSGAQSLRIERIKAEPWAIASQTVPAQALAGKRVRLGAAVQAEWVEGKGAGPMLILQGAGGRTIANAQRLLPRTPGWQQVSVELDVSPGAEWVEVGLLFEGGGVVRFADVRLEVLGPVAAKP